MLIYAIVGHLIGDYLLQNDLLAEGKKRSSLICGMHCLSWTVAVCAWAGWWNWWVPPVLFLTHFIQDRGSLIVRWMRFNGQAKFAAAPMAPWSIIVVDNVWHIVTLAVVAKILGA